MNKPATIDEYLAGIPEDSRATLGDIRNVIQEAVPDATEAIRYGMPTFRLNGKNMIHFAAFPAHIGLYATPDGQAAFEAELDQYERGKGSVRFPIDQPVPLELIRRIARFRADTLRNTKGV